MTNAEQTKAFFNTAQGTSANQKPAAPFAARQVHTDRRCPDPSSVLRSDRYPIPSFFEYRMRVNE